MKSFLFILIAVLVMVPLFGYATETANIVRDSAHDSNSHSDHHKGEEDHHLEPKKKATTPSIEHRDTNEDEHGHDSAQSTKIDEVMANDVGVVTAVATSQTLNQSVVVYGSLATGPEQLSHVRARYPGMIKSVNPTIGDKVERGQLLAEVESNESLKLYQVRSPITGTVIQHHANSGEVTQDQVLFYIANFDTLWAEFRIYPTQQSIIKAGQTAHIVANDEELTGTIRHIIPALDKPYQLARVSFDNRTKRLTPGLLVEGHIVIDTFMANVAVEKDAIQTVGDQVGVFTKKGNEYTFAPLTLGRRDNRYIEVLSGLPSGQIYVYKNSYLIKADIEKSEAEHDH